MSISTNGCDARYDRERFTGGVIGKLLAGTKIEAYHARLNQNARLKIQKWMVLEKVWLRAKRKGQL
jgi:hypothetical protein